MTPHPIRILTECDTMLADISRHYQTALDRLHEASPGFPAHTPGAGEPGGGKGFTAGSITERLADKRHPELDALQRLQREPGEIMANVAYFAHQLGIPPPTPHPANRHVQLLAWSRWVVRRILTTETDVASKSLDIIHRSIVNLHRTVTAWAYTPTKPKRPNPALLAEDPTGELCRSCLRAGSRSYRYRGDLCRWCYEFFTCERFLPPPTIIETRASGKRITEAMVAPHRQAHRERNKRKRKKAG